jgi:geranylgeranyl pyrophosphate synthase
VVSATTRLKTAALCQLAAELGALAAGAPDPITAATRRFAGTVGTGLQMLDDLGSLTCATRRAKGREDLCAGRPTWPWAWLAQHHALAWPRLAAMSRGIAGGEVGEAQIEGQVDALAGALVEHTASVGRACIRHTLDTGLAALIATVGDNRTTHMVAAELRRMEDSYG